MSCKNALTCQKIFSKILWNAPSIWPKWSPFARIPRWFDFEGKNFGNFSKYRTKKRLHRKKSKIFPSPKNWPLTCCKSNRWCNFRVKSESLNGRYWHSSGHQREAVTSVWFQVEQVSRVYLSSRKFSFFTGRYNFGFQHFRRIGHQLSGYIGNHLNIVHWRVPKHFAHVGIRQVSWKQCEA